MKALQHLTAALGSPSAVCAASSEPHLAFTALGWWGGFADWDICPAVVY